MEPPIKQPDTDRQYILLAFRILADFGIGLAAPVVILTIIGRRLDMQHGTKPWFMIAGFVLSALLSGTYVWRRAKAYGAEYEALGKKDSTQNK